MNNYYNNYDVNGNVAEVVICCGTDIGCNCLCLHPFEITMHNCVFPFPVSYNIWS